MLRLREKQERVATNRRDWTDDEKRLHQSDTRVTPSSALGSGLANSGGFLSRFLTNADEAPVPCAPVGAKCAHNQAVEFDATMYASNHVQHFFDR